jgi:hypothetical protein
VGALRPGTQKSTTTSSNSGSVTPEPAPSSMKPAGLRFVDDPTPHLEVSSHAPYAPLSSQAITALYAASPDQWSAKSSQVLSPTITLPPPSTTTSPPPLPLPPRLWSPCSAAR